MLAVQGALYVATGLWPIVHMASFEAVTGPKTDDWLVHTVGLLLAVIGVIALAAVARVRRTDRTIDPLIVALAVAAALALAVIEVVYVINGTIAKIYLADAAIELGFAVLLLAGFRPAGRPRPASP